MANHTIVITQVGSGHAVPFPSKTVAHVDDTLQYDTDPPGLDFEVVLDGSPFSNVPAQVINDRNQRTLVTPGRFFWKCFLILPPPIGRIGWVPNEEPMESGGDVDVRP